MPLRSAEQPDNLTNGQAQTEEDSLSAKLAREGELFSNLPLEALKGTLNMMKDEPIKAIQAFAMGVGGGLIFGALTKNPGVFGKTMSRFIHTGLEQSGKVAGTVAAVDWAVRLGDPALAVWNDRTVMSEAKMRLGKNVGEGIMLYSFANNGALLGVGVAHKLVRASTAPALNFTPAKPGEKISFWDDAPSLGSVALRVSPLIGQDLTKHH